MAIITNSASLTFNNERTASSNEVDTEVRESQSVAIVKDALLTNYVPGEPVGYVITVTNTGTINLGENSTGIYYKAEPTGPFPGASGGVSNNGRIASSSNNVIGITFDSPYSNKTFVNEAAGVIEHLAHPVKRTDGKSGGRQTHTHQRLAHSG